MISYHPDSAGLPVGQHFTRGFLTVDTDDPERLAKGISRYAWAPGIFRDGYRSRQNFLFADWLGLDFEAPEFTLKDALKSFCDMIHVVGTTRNHGVEKSGRILDRFRVLIKLERRCESADDLRETLRRIAMVYPIDRQCIDEGRHFFPCKDIVSIGVDGYSQEITPATMRDERWRARAQSYAQARILPPETRWKLTSVVPTGTRNNTFFGVAKDLLRVGFAADTVMTMIANSPTYGGALNPEIESELWEVIASGQRQLAEEIAADGRRNDTEG